MSVCVNPTPSYKKFGYSERFMQSVRRTFGSEPNPRSLARNLGLDAEDAVNLSHPSRKGKIFGRNLKKVEEFEADVAANKGVPKDTIVSMPDPDGGSIRHFLSNANNSTVPSRWVFDGGSIKPNPHWDSVSVNQTINESGELRTFVRDNNGLYRPPRKGETGDYYLNVQKAVQTDEPFDNSYIVQRGIDAYEVSPNTYRLVDENSQAVPIKKVNQESGKDAVAVQTTETPLSEAEIKSSLLSNGLSQKVAGAVAGGIAGNMADEYDDFGGAFWGGALGFMVGHPKLRSSVRGVFSKSGKKSGDPYKDLQYEASVYENKVRRQRELSLEGLHDSVDPDGPVAEGFIEHYVNPKRQARNDGLISEDSKFAKFRKLAFDNDWFKSGIYNLRSLGSDTAEELLQIFRQFEHASNNMYNKFSNVIQDKFGTRDTKAVFDNTQIEFIRGVYGDQVTDAQALESFGASAQRIIRNRARIENGEFRFDDSVAGRSDYLNPEVQRLDRQLLEDPEARKIIDVTQEYFDQQGKELVNTLRHQMQRTLELSQEAGGINGKYKNIARVIGRNEHEVSDWLRANPNERKLYNEAMKQDAAFRRYVEQHNKANAIENLEGKYIPQKWDNAKAQRIKNQWQQDNAEQIEAYVRQGDGNVDPSVLREEAWNRKVAADILATNNKKWELFSFDSAGNRASRKYFANQRQAQNKLEDLIGRNLDETEFDIVSRRDNMMDFIRQETVGGKNMYYLEVPQRFREMGGGNMFADENIDAIAQAHRNQRIDSAVTKSNHLDRARNYNIPTMYLKNNIDDLVRSYTRDVGPRFTALKNGMYDDSQVESMFRKIRNEALAKNPNQKESIDQNLSTARTWYKVLQGHKAETQDLQNVISADETGRRGLSQEFLKRARNDTLLNSLGRFATAPFMYATSFYAPLQMAVLGPFLYGWRNTFNAYKTAITDPSRLKAMSEELRKMNHIYDGIEAYSPERRAEYRQTLLGENYSPSLEKFNKLADSMENFAANLSLTKPLLGKAGISMDDTGIFRLFGGSLLDVSGAEASLSALGAMRHIEDLVEAGARLQKNPDLRTVKIRGNNLNMSQIRRQLEDMAIDDVDRFIRQKDEFNKFADQVGGGKAKPDDWMYGQMTQALGEAVNSYHGKSKLTRQLRWLDNPFGRLISQFSTYTQNFGIQTTRQRIYLPIRDWDSKYGSQIADDTSMFRLAFEAGRGNDRFFRDTFGSNWQQAYDEFPTQAYSNFFKVFGALGVGKTLLIGRAGVMDFLEIVTNEAIGNDDYEAWSGVNRQMGLGFRDPVTDREVTLGDVFEDGITGFEMLRATRAAFEDAIQLGFAGPYTGKVLDMVRYDSGPMNAFPVGSSVQGLFDIMANMYRTPMQDIPRETAKDVLDFGLLHTPPIGTMHGMRQGISDAVIQKPSNRRSGRDATTGESMDFNFVNY